MPKNPEDKGNESKPLLLTDRPWSEMEQFSSEDRLSGRYRDMPDIREVMVSPIRPLSIPVIVPMKPARAQAFPAADPKLISAGYLKANAPSTNVNRQGPATAGDSKKRSVGKSSFDNDRDSYFVKTKIVTVDNKQVQLHALVLGWNHAAVLLRTPEGYVVHRLYCYAGNGGGHKAFGVVDELKLLPQSGDTLVDKKRGPWNIMKPPPLILERLVTYGVSSCSVAVLYSLPDAEVITISHMSGVPPIPVGLMMEPFVDGDDELQLVVSHLPQSAELMKFDLGTIFSEKVKCHTLLMSRGKLPTRTEGTQLFPQMGHTDAGVYFPLKGKPCFQGTLGVGQDLDYWTLLPEPISARLQAATKPESFSQQFIFATSADFAKLVKVGIASDELIEFFAKRGHILETPAIVLAAKDGNGKAWLVGTRSRQYKISLVENSLIFSCATEANDIVADVIRPLLDGVFGFPQIHHDLYDAIRPKLSSFLSNYKPKPRGWFEEVSKIDTCYLAIVDEAKKTKNARLVFARLLGTLLTFNPGEHPFANAVKLVMQKHRYDIDIPLEKIPLL
jgi:hypothetical protein